MCDVTTPCQVPRHGDPFVFSLTYFIDYVYAVDQFLLLHFIAFSLKTEQLILSVNVLLIVRLLSLSMEGAILSQRLVGLTKEAVMRVLVLLVKGWGLSLLSLSQVL